MIWPLLLGAACSAGPPAVEQWEARILQGSRIADDPDLKRPVVTRGRIEVFVANARWGKLPILTDTGSYLELAFTLPPGLDPGSSFGAHHRNGYLRIGSSDVGYESRVLEGTVTVVASSPEVATLDLDLWARAPTIDLNHLGDKHIQGRIQATVTEPPDKP